MNINLIVAVDELGGFGKDGKIPWIIPEDMTHFKEVTKDAVCIMGRRTYQDMFEMRTSGGEPTESFTLLPNRDSYVITRNDEFEVIGGTRESNMHRVFQKYKDTDREVFVIGGYRMFVEVLAWKPNIHMTIIKGKTYDCDVSFPLEALKDYSIVNAKETDQCYYVEYKNHK